MTQQKIREITNDIVKKYQPEKVILYGSHAWGKPREDSDIDLFIVKDTEKNVFERNREVCKIIFDKGEAVDVLVYTTSQLEKRERMGDPFVRRIIASGKILYAAK